MLKAYFDDSNVGGGTVAVLAGWIAPANTWPLFVEDWDRVLRMSPRIGYFKWKEWRGSSGEFAGISEPKKYEKLNLLIDVLAEYNPLQVSCVSSNALHRQAFGNISNSQYAKSLLHFVLFGCYGCNRVRLRKISWRAS